MPRRTYNPKARRPRPTRPDPDALRILADQLHAKTARTTNPTGRNNR